MPSVHGQTVVFTAEGDLWQVGTEGGTARRLTSHPGDELYAAFSPDGQTIAYSANYEGPREVYTIPASGGLPLRRTFDGLAPNSPFGGAKVIGWTPDGKIIYATPSRSPLPDMQLATINPQNQIDLVPLSQAAQGTYSPNGKTLFFTRLSKQPSFNKRYEGGSAENIWKFALGGEAAAMTADYAGTSKNAMWWKGRVYFLSDRDGTMNLWSMDENGRSLRQHTKHQGFDIKSASLSDGHVVYALGADLRLFDIASNADRAIPIELPSDFDNLREHWVKNPTDYLTSVHFSNDGNSVVVTARGRAFVAPVKQGRFVDLNPHKPGRFREARMMPDGKSVVLLSTESGEAEVWTYPGNGNGAGKQLTKDATVLRWEAIPSPDGKWIAHQDKAARLWLLDAASGQQRQVAMAINPPNAEAAFSGLRWSPDSRWLAYAENAKNGFLQVKIFSVETGVTTAVTSDRYDSGSPSWSADGKWLYFVSDRALRSTVRSPWGARLPDPFFDRSDKVYEVMLKKGAVSPFQPPDELHPAKPDPVPAASTPKPPSVVKVSIDLDGLTTRVEEVPVQPGNYTDLVTTDKRLCWINHVDSINREKDALECLDMANKGDKPETLIDGVKGFEVSGDNKKILVHKGNDLFVFDSHVTEAAMKTPTTMTDAHVDLKNWNFSVIPSEEFHELFLDAWRLERDYFYDKNMHKVSWTTVRDKYGEFLGRVRDRAELSDLISEMVSELSTLHTFVRGGDLRRGPDQIQVASLGAALVRDEAAGGYQVQHIYKTDPDRPDKLSPLLKPSVGLVEGDVIKSMNGRELLQTAGTGDVLRDQAGKQMLLTFHHQGDSQTHDVVATAISQEQEADMRYGEWEYTRRLKVEDASNSKLAYVHLRAMGPNDIAQWEEQYTPIFDRDGLIVDVRHNHGGNIDSWILGKLLRKPWMYWQGREGIPYWNMQGAFRGPVVVLCDEQTSSDGEAFAEGFRRLGLGKLIGTRTWGGEIWLSASNSLADNGIATAAEMGTYGPERKWLIEGHGVDPDMVVDNLPHATFEGKDAQLDAAIHYLEQQLRAKPNAVPAPPPYPDKSFKARHEKDSTN